MHIDGDYVGRKLGSPQTWGVVKMDFNMTFSFVFPKITKILRQHQGIVVAVWGKYWDIVAMTNTAAKITVRLPTIFKCKFSEVINTSVQIKSNALKTKNTVLR